MCGRGRPGTHVSDQEGGRPAGSLLSTAGSGGLRRYLAVRSEAITDSMMDIDSDALLTSQSLADTGHRVTEKNIVFHIEAVFC